MVRRILFPDPTSPELLLKISAPNRNGSVKIETEPDCLRVIIIDMSSDPDQYREMSEPAPNFKS